MKMFLFVNVESTLVGVSVIDLKPARHFLKSKKSSFNKSWINTPVMSLEVRSERRGLHHHGNVRPSLPRSESSSGCYQLLLFIESIIFVFAVNLLPILKNWYFKFRIQRSSLRSNDYHPISETERKTEQNKWIIVFKNMSKWNYS